MTITRCGPSNVIHPNGIGGQVDFVWPPARTYATWECIVRVGWPNEKRNKWDFHPACILKDTCFLGQGTKDLINRIAGHRHGDTFASEGHNDEMFKAGVFSAPRATAYWKRALLATMINAREKAIAEGKARAMAGTN